MRKLSIGAALVAAAIAVPLSIGSSHREAPNISLDPTADNTDVYAFTAKDAPGALTVVANWIPGEVPANGPNFFRFDDRARYYIHVDNTGDGREDVSYRFEFESKVNPKSYLQAFPGVESIDDPKLYQRQSYDIVRETHRGGKTREKRIARNLPVAPSYAGPKTFPNYNAVAGGAVKNLAGGGKVFAGQRDDPFFVDLGAVFDAANLRELTGNKGSGRDDLSGMSTHAIVLQVPESKVTRNGRGVSGADAGNAVVGVWSTTERRRLEVTNADFDKNGASKGRYVQVSRLGNPLVNEVVIPAGDKDKFNRTRPHNDAANYGKYVVEPELAKILNALFDIGAPEMDRTDIIQALLQGLPGLNEHPGPGSPLPVDTLKLNLGVPPAETENRFGVIGGDNAGFPNGRRLGDDVVDIELQVVAGFLKGNMVPLGDGVDQNDKPFLSAFPYLPGPTSGFDSDPSDRFEPAHEGTPAGGGS
jgi:Domain of unknown function (DUF4331)